MLNRACPALRCICTAYVSQESGSLRFKNKSNLKSKHKDLYEKAQKDAQLQVPTTSLTQPTLKQVLEKTTKWTLNDPRTEEMDKLLMEIIATHIILPFAVVEAAGFKRVMAKAKSRYPLKTDSFPYKEDG